MTDQDTPSEANGSDPLSKEQLENARRAAKRAAAGFGEVAALMMRTSPYNEMRIKDLQWLVGPAIATGQFAVAEARDKNSGQTMPVGAVLWAMVSDDVDKKLSADGGETVRLEAKEWRSGSVPWIVAAIGDSKVVSHLLERLAKSQFTDQPARIRGRDKDGKATVGMLRLKKDESDTTTG